MRICLLFAILALKRLKRFSPQPTQSEKNVNPFVISRQQTQTLKPQNQLHAERSNLCYRTNMVMNSTGTLPNVLKVNA